MSIKYQTVVIAHNADTSVDVVSDVLDIRFNLGIFISAVFSTLPSGKLVLQGSNDLVNWEKITEVNVSSQHTLINVGDIFAPYVRVFKLADGAGSVTITATIKGV